MTVVRPLVVIELLRVDDKVNVVVEPGCDRVLVMVSVVSVFTRAGNPITVAVASCDLVLVRVTVVS